MHVIQGMSKAQKHRQAAHEYREYGDVTRAHLHDDRADALEFGLAERHVKSWSGKRKKPYQRALGRDKYRQSDREKARNAEKKDMLNNLGAQVFHFGTNKVKIRVGLAVIGKAEDDAGRKTGILARVLDAVRYEDEGKADESQHVQRIKDSFVRIYQMPKQPEVSKMVYIMTDEDMPLLSEETWTLECPFRHVWKEFMDD